MPSSSAKDPPTDLDLRVVTQDIDLRQLGLPFKPMQNYTPATEIDASINTHEPITWKIHPVEIPSPDYSGLKLNSMDACSSGDPRLRKIFRLGSTDEKESPASPIGSPKAVTNSPTVARSDPRRRKQEENRARAQIDGRQMSYQQQLHMLQGSAFYQSLTSNQKVIMFIQ